MSIYIFCLSFFCKLKTKKESYFYKGKLCNESQFKSLRIVDKRYHESMEAI